MNNIKHIALLLTCYNRKDTTLRCLESLYQNQIPKNFLIKVFLVDDGCTDGTADAVKTQFPQVNIIMGNGNLFWNRGMHLAWETARQAYDFDFYLWVNDDVVLFDYAIIDLLNINSRNPDAIVSGLMHSEKNGKTTYSGYNRKSELLNPNGREQLCLLFHGNLVLVPRIVFGKLGNLEPKFKHAIGDFDYAMRAEKLGIKKYLNSRYSGYCEKHEELPKWCLPQTSFSERIKSLYSPTGGCPPFDFFFYELRHHNVLVAVKHFLSIHLRLIVPRLWIKS